MFEIQCVTFSNGKQETIRFIRNSVFTCEQGVAPATDFDGKDHDAIHILASFAGNAAGTGRMLDDGHIGRIAVLKNFRGQGIGRAIMLSLIEQAVKHGYPRVYLGAQKQAVGFYRKLGFTACGEEYVEAGIEHVTMEKTVNT